MAHDLLGPSFDIHGGGIDLVFPHHENEAAQSRCAHPEGSFANIWMHNGFVNVEGEKMSKSLGNFFTVRDLLDKGVPGEVIRFVLLSTHYRSPMDFTEEKIEEAKATLWSFIEAIRGIEAEPPDGVVVDALSDDLNTAEAIARLHALKKNGQFGALFGSARLMGLFNFEASVGSLGWGVGRNALSIANSVARRWAALRREQRYEEADHLKAQALEAGIILEVVKEGVGQGAKAKLLPDFAEDRAKELAK